MIVCSLKYLNKFHVHFQQWISCYVKIPFRMVLFQRLTLRSWSYHQVLIVTVYGWTSVMKRKRTVWSGGEGFATVVVGGTRTRGAGPRRPPAVSRDERIIYTIHVATTRRANHVVVTPSTTGRRRTCARPAPQFGSSRSTVEPKFERRPQLFDRTASRTLADEIPVDTAGSRRKTSPLVFPLVGGTDLRRGVWEPWTKNKTTWSTGKIQILNPLFYDKIPVTGKILRRFRYRRNVIHDVMSGQVRPSPVPDDRPWLDHVQRRRGTRGIRVPASGLPRTAVGVVHWSGKWEFATRRSH